VTIVGRVGATAIVGEATVLKGVVTAMKGVYGNMVKIFLKFLIFFVLNNFYIFLYYFDMLC
jgi:hypothetical protein